MRLDVDVLERNIRLMSDWATDRQLALSPHVKTTMSPQIVQRQVAAGVHRLTVATLPQAAVVLDWGHRDILVANEVVTREDHRTLRHWVDTRPEVTVSVFVDSVEVVRGMAEYFSVDRPLPVLVDVGTVGGRSGVRTHPQFTAVVAAVRAAPGLRLEGVAGYEGVIGNERTPRNLSRVAEHCGRIVDWFLSIEPALELERPVVSMGGSIFTDAAARAMRAGLPATVLKELRSGCYAVHDHGIYRRAQPVPDLTPAATVEAVIVSAPEPGVHVIGAGKRDVPYDAGYPIILQAGGDASPDLEVTALFDHHMVAQGQTRAGVGDTVRLGISHPCSLFDRYDQFDATIGDAVVARWSTAFTRDGAELVQGAARHSNAAIAALRSGG